MNNPRSLAVSTALTLLTAACGGGNSLAPAGLSAPAKHPFFPLEPGTVLVYQGELDGLPRTEILEVGDQVRQLGGVACRPVTERAYLGGELVERSTEWLALDLQGNLWRFGEEAEELTDDGWVRSPDSWLAGEGDIRPWVALPATLAPGDVFAGSRPHGVDRYSVRAVGDSVVVPAGAFTGCLTLVENPDDPDDADIILYAPGVGRVAERDAHGHVELVGVRPRPAR